jgi:predicted DsbA family dithiol-disulfide isomerase
MVEFGDFECPYCGAAEPTVKKVLATYSDDVALVFVNFPISFHQYAMGAAEAFLAAAIQGKGWEMHDQMYANQAALSDADLDRYAQIIGLDMGQFDKDRSRAFFGRQFHADFQHRRVLDRRGPALLRFPASDRPATRSALASICGGDSLSI